MPRPSNWRNGPTTAIRVPCQFADELLAIARQLDGQEEGIGDRYAQERSALALSIEPEETYVSTYSPVLVGVGEDSYLINPPKMLAGDQARLVDEAADRLLAELEAQGKDALFYVVGEMAKQLGRKLG